MCCMYVVEVFFIGGKGIDVVRVFCKFYGVLCGFLKLDFLVKWILGDFDK